MYAFCDLKSLFYLYTHIDSLFCRLIDRHNSFTDTRLSTLALRRRRSATSLLSFLFFSSLEWNFLPFYLRYNQLLACACVHGCALGLIIPASGISFNTFLPEFNLAINQLTHSFPPARFLFLRKQSSIHISRNQATLSFTTFHYSSSSSKNTLPTCLV